MDAPNASTSSGSEFKSCDLTKKDITDMNILKQKCISALPTPNTEATTFVNKLLKSGIVYRICDQPLAELKQIPPNFKYCILGYFIGGDGSYQFINAEPLAQYYCIGNDGITLELLETINYLNKNVFCKEYQNNDEVFQANDLSLTEPLGIPCINFLKIKTFFAKSVEKEIEDLIAENEKTIDKSTRLKNEINISMGITDDLCHAIEELEKIDDYPSTDDFKNEDTETKEPIDETSVSPIELIPSLTETSDSTHKLNDSMETIKVQLDNPYDKDTESNGIIKDDNDSMETINVQTVEGYDSIKDMDNPNDKNTESNGIIKDDKQSIEEQSVFNKELIQYLSDFLANKCDPIHNDLIVEVNHFLQNLENIDHLAHIEKKTNPNDKQTEYKGLIKDDKESIVEKSGFNEESIPSLNDFNEKISDLTNILNNSMEIFNDVTVKENNSMGEMGKIDQLAHNDKGTECKGLIKDDKESMLATSDSIEKSITSLNDLDDGANAPHKLNLLMEPSVEVQENIPSDRGTESRALIKEDMKSIVETSCVSNAELSLSLNKSVEATMFSSVESNHLMDDPTDLPDEIKLLMIEMNESNATDKDTETKEEKGSTEESASTEESTYYSEKDAESDNPVEVIEQAVDVSSDSNEELSNFLREFFVEK